MSSFLTNEGELCCRSNIKEFQASEKLKPENGGSKESFSFEQSELLTQHLKRHTYLYAKDIAVYVKSMWNISYIVSGMTDWLNRNRFSYKKPSLVPGKANLEIQEKSSPFLGSLGTIKTKR